MSARGAGEEGVFSRASGPGHAPMRPHRYVWVRQFQGEADADAAAGDSARPGVLPRRSQPREIAFLDDWQGPANMTLIAAPTRANFLAGISAGGPRGACAAKIWPRWTREEAQRARQARGDQAHSRGGVHGASRLARREEAMCRPGGRVLCRARTTGLRGRGRAGAPSPRGTACGSPASSQENVHVGLFALQARAKWRMDHCSS